jgi:hypothetical protein
MYRVDNDRGNRRECYQGAKDERDREDDAVRDARATVTPI